MPSFNRPEAKSHPSNFQTRTATDDAGELNRRLSILDPELTPSPPERTSRGQQQASNRGSMPNPYDPATNDSIPPPRNHSFTKKLLHLHDGSNDHHSTSPSGARRRSVSTKRRIRVSGNVNEESLAAQMNNTLAKANVDASTPKPGLVPRPVGGNEKLGTFSGVFVPTCLNVLSILMFLRFGFILGQGGVLGIMGMLIVSYIINLITTLSLSAIATNGTVRGGGAYYLISRSLGPEFGGSIGVVFYLGFVFNTSLNAVGLIDCLRQNFGKESGNWYNWLPEDAWWSYLWATIVLIFCTTICLGGSGIFARASNGLLVVLLISTFSIPVSALFVAPFESRKLGIEYTGLSAKTFMGNFMPQLTRGAAGSQLKGRETFQDLFGILFPATGGIFAGASMSGDLKHPSKAIPKGTLYGLGLTFVAYTLVILAMAGTITRASFIRNVNVIQDTNMSGFIILAGEFASCFFSTLMGVIGSAKLLQALARDKLLPGFTIFGQGTTNGDEPTHAIIATYIVAQVVMLSDINQIASFVTMTYLMTFLVMNLATFLLKIGSAPNFRPSFHFFSWETALAGTIVSGAAMFFVDGVYASGCVAILIIIFLLIHYTTPPRSWGDVSQSLIYHQVRKYLLRLRQEHVKFWRPQILLFVNDPRRQYKLIQFCNSMKKGALYILGHVIVSQDFGGSVPEARRQQVAWMKYIDFSKVKAFVNIAISPGVEWGARNIVLGAGLGGMRPNIVVLGFYNMDDLRHSKPLVDISNSPEQATSSTSNGSTQIDGTTSKDKNDEEVLPTDSCRTESMMSVTSYVTILEDLLLNLQINVALARGFQNLEFPHPDKDNNKRYLDLWPIQMSAEIVSEGDDKANVLTTNFDTYTLILQLGCILMTVPAWKKVYTLRVAVFVEYESDVDEERGRVKTLLENLRINAEIMVFWLASGDLPTYEVILNGQNPGLDAEMEVDECLKDQDWWEELQKIRGKRGEPTASEELADVASILGTGSAWPDAAFQQGPRHERVERFLGLRKLLRKSKRRHTMSGLNRLGVSLGMRTHRLPERLVKEHPSNASASEDSGSSSEDGSSDTDVFESDDEEEPSTPSAASEGDIDDFESEPDTDSRPINASRIARRRSHGDSMRGPPPSKRSTGEREPKISESRVKKSSTVTSTSGTVLPPSTPETGARPLSSDSAGSKAASISNITKELTALRKSESLDGSSNPIASTAVPLSPRKLEERFSALRDRSLMPPPLSQPSPQTSTQSSPLRPVISRHSSMPKFSSKPVPMTRVAAEDGPGPSIMFTDTPSPPNRRNKLPSAYHSQYGATTGDLSDNIAEMPENESTPQLSRHGSTYSTQAIPLSFNDLPCRAQHLILNELMRQNSSDTAVMFTTLPSPMEGTSLSEEASVAYLSDLEVLCKDCPPCLMVHSNSMTVTMSL